ncbi:MAG TPA: YgiT-type zinc finger protein [Alphaproteobacteria bacterium]|nr:YgiT-type zinc finger protein [Alphaproteobacteria bacterium]
MNEMRDMIEKCAFCGNMHITPSKTRYIYHHGDQMLVVNDVPCFECDYCGEEYFEAAVLKKMEGDFQKIERENKKPQQIIKVPVEDFSAI